jgi:alpha-mannosidase
MLTTEWRSRIESWRNELKAHFYRPLGQAELEGFTTREHLPVEQAAKGKFKPMPVGTAWGAKWEYGWFRFTIVTPKEAAGQRFVLQNDPDYEGLVFVDGKVAQSTDGAHRETTLAHKGVAGRKYHILVEGYGGHGPWVCYGGPIPPDRQTVPEPPHHQRKVGPVTFGIWQEEVFQLFIDVDTLYSTRNSIDPESLQVSEIDQGLRDFTTLVDFNQEREGFFKGVAAARKRLKPLLACTNGTSAPTLYAFGHAHLDVAWLWPLEETERKAARTLSNQLVLAEEYPGYKFLHSQAHLFWMVQQHYPELYKRVVAAVKAGKVIADGGMWVEADTNIAGGEALVRQFMHGKRFFADEFGAESRMMWLPDVFGYSGAMPQIMKGCGIDYFSTAKILWNYNGGEPFPFTTFKWEGIDGSWVLAHMTRDYNLHTTPANVLGRWRDREQKDGLATRMIPFGWGDGGGGPARDHLEYVKRLKDFQSIPKVKLAAPIEFFRDQEARGVPDARYVGELYYQCHRGTYTTQARTKRGNRKSELALREAEMWSAAAGALGGKKYKFPAAKMDAAWKNLLLHQFHDILPGSSIRRVYEEAESAFGKVISDAGDVAAEAQSALTHEQANSVTAFNSLSWDRKTLVPLGKKVSGASYDSCNCPVEVQTIAGQTFAEMELPSCGFASLKFGPGVEPSDSPNGLTATERSLENEHLRIRLNDRGELVGIFDKDAQRELAAGPCNSFKMYKDVPGNFEAWDIDSTYMLNPVELPEKAEIKVVAAGPLVAILRVTRKLNRSTVVQEIRLRRDSRRVDFVTTVEWHERQKLLKVAFPVTVHSNEAIHEIQFGHLRRPTHASRQFDADRFEVSNHKWSALAEEDRGVAVINDCKYGLNVAGNSINLTLLRSTLAPDHKADVGHQEFTYAFYAWNGSLAQSNVVREAYEVNCPVTTAPGSAGEVELLTVDAPTVVIDTVKPAEDGSGDVIVRLYESMRTATRCTLWTGLPVKSARATDMLENDQGPLKFQDGKVELEFRPFEIKTVRLKR